INIQFLYENKKVFVVDEYGRLEAMDYIGNKDQLCFKSLSSHVRYLFSSTASVERKKCK
ncbi:hypothetical protein BDC45DRAFT_447252, partial [Circinella umbellata]